MFESAITGFLAALIVFLSRFIQIKVPQLINYTPVGILAVGALSVFFQKFLLYRKHENSNYDGIPDLLIHIHAPWQFSSVTRWLIRGIQSFLFSLLNGGIGPEGAAIEWGMALQVRLQGSSSRWFEQKRRTQVATSMAAGISAAFSAPFAGVLFPIELGVGGKNLFSIIGALTSFIFIRYFSSYFSLGNFELSKVLSQFHFYSWQQWASAIIIGIVSGLVSAGLSYCIVYIQENLRSLFKIQTWMKALASSVLIALIYSILSKYHLMVDLFSEHIFWIHYNSQFFALLFFSTSLVFSFILAGFGTVGVFWSLFLLGGLFGTSFNDWVLTGFSDFSAIAWLASGVSFMGATLGAPFAASVLALELAQNYQVAILCFFSCIIAGFVRNQVTRTNLVERQLIEQGCSLILGRSKLILEGIPIRDAMVTDHEWIHEQEPISELYSRAVKFRYAVLPVVNSKGVYKGLLTVDAIEASYLAESTPSAQHLPSTVSKFIEVKDLVYRSGIHLTPAKITDSLASIIANLEQVPCIPVLGDDGKLLGLLFGFSVRQAYEREIMRRSLLGFQEAPQK